MVPPRSEKVNGDKGNALSSWVSDWMKDGLRASSMEVQPSVPSWYCTGLCTGFGGVFLSLLTPLRDFSLSVVVWLLCDLSCIASIPVCNCSLCSLTQVPARFTLRVLSYCAGTLGEIADQRVNKSL